ncbi:MAG: sugar phosphate isomerase/epimerase [Planctomycetia bacterium]|nr:sugar phosphate isomerase/epimerase [Planctomycetia bacterium]
MQGFRRQSSPAATVSRRDFLAMAAAILGPACLGESRAAAAPPVAGQPLFRISLAEWSLHRAIFAGKLDNLDFPKEARQKFGIEAVEYVNQFFKDKAKDADYLAELRKRADDEGVTNVLVMCDGLGRLGDPEAPARTKAVENHFPWVEAAKRLGCHSIRVNAASKGSFEEQQKLAADGLSRLAEYAGQMEMSVLVENHGGLSSNGAWLAGVMKLVGRPNCGTLPDFGNFHDYDRYRGVEELMPFAKGVSAKSHEFDEAGNEVRTDFARMIRLVVGAGYHGWIGVEYEGTSLPEAEGILATKRLLERIRAEMQA